MTQVTGSDYIIMKILAVTEIHGTKLETANTCCQKCKCQHVYKLQKCMKPELHSCHIYNGMGWQTKDLWFTSGKGQ
jgi:hypothetical protein